MLRLYEAKCGISSFYFVVFHRLWNQKQLFTKKIPMQNIAYNIQGKDEVKSHTYLMVSYAVVEATCVRPWKMGKIVICIKPMENITY